MHHQQIRTVADDAPYHISQDIEQGQAQSKQQNGRVYDRGIPVRDAGHDEVAKAGDGKNLLDHDSPCQVECQHLKETGDDGDQGGGNSVHKQDPSFTQTAASGVLCAV